ncbi:MAG TPA: hypothetical protein G4O03_01730 [Dehalococcoidia bacterium]|nr:hypothetical protein [Dehalococcoidia bacterium]
MADRVQEHWPGYIPRRYRDMGDGSFAERQVAAIEDASGQRINPAKEDGNLASILAQLDMTLSALRDAICAAAPDSKSLNDLYTRLDSINNRVYEASQTRTNYGSSTGAALTVDLDTSELGGRMEVDVWVKSSAAATFEVRGSRNGTDWRLIDTISLSAAGEEHRHYSNAYRHLRVTTPAANNNEAEIVATR